MAQPRLIPRPPRFQSLCPYPLDCATCSSKNNSFALESSGETRFIIKAIFLYLQNDAKASVAYVIVRQVFSKENILRTQVKQKDNPKKFSFRIFVIPWMLVKKIFIDSLSQHTQSQILYWHWGTFSLIFIMKLFGVGVLMFLLSSLVLHLDYPLLTQCKFKKMKEKFKWGKNSLTNIYFLHCTRGVVIQVKCCEVDKILTYIKCL